MPPAILEASSTAKVYDLGQPYFSGMPHHPSHPPFLYGMTKKHGDFVSSTGMSSAAESITLGSHVGTHIDGFGHFSCGGKLFGGFNAAHSQSEKDGLSVHAIAGVAPIVRRGFLFDVAGHFHMETLPEDFPVTPRQLDEIADHRKLDVRPGDIVLLRTGWARYWRDSHMFITGGKGKAVTGPGPEIEAAKWLSDRKVFAAGSDTVAFERVPSEMPVHVHFLVESGIHIIECLNLEELAADGVYEFLFLAAPMKIEGGTGAPVRPIAMR